MVGIGRLRGGMRGQSLRMYRWAGGGGQRFARARTLAMSAFANASTITVSRSRFTTKCDDSSRRAEDIRVPRFPADKQKRITPHVCPCAFDCNEHPHFLLIAPALSPAFLRTLSLTPARTVHSAEAFCLRRLRVLDSPQHPCWSERKSKAEFARTSASGLKERR
jgi:hypothetical protein